MTFPFIQLVTGVSSDCPLSRSGSVQMTIRRLPIWSAPPEAGPFTKEVNKKFHLHLGGITVEATLPKEIFYHNESIPLFLVVGNNSSNTVTRVVVKVRD